MRFTTKTTKRNSAGGSSLLPEILDSICKIRKIQKQIWKPGNQEETDRVVDLFLDSWFPDSPVNPVFVLFVSFVVDRAVLWPRPAPTSMISWAVEPHY